MCKKCCETQQEILEQLKQMNEPLKVEIKNETAINFPPPEDESSTVLKIGLIDSEGKVVSVSDFNFPEPTVFPESVEPKTPLFSEPFHLSRFWDLAANNLNAKLLGFLDDDGEVVTFNFENKFSKEEETPKVNSELVKELVDQIVTEFADDFLELKRILVLSTRDYSMVLCPRIHIQLLKLAPDLGIYANDHEDTYYETAEDDKDTIRAVTFIHPKAIISVDGIDYDFVFIDSELYKTLEHPLSFSDDLNGYLERLLRERQGQLIVFDKNPEFGKYSITKFAR